MQISYTLNITPAETYYIRSLVIFFFKPNKLLFLLLLKTSGKGLF